MILWNSTIRFLILAIEGVPEVQIRFGKLKQIVIEQYKCNCVVTLHVLTLGFALKKLKSENNEFRQVSIFCKMRFEIISYLHDFMQNNINVHSKSCTFVATQVGTYVPTYQEVPISTLCTLIVKNIWTVGIINELYRYININYICMYTIISTTVHTNIFFSKRYSRIVNLYISTSIIFLLYVRTLLYICMKLSSVVYYYHICMYRLVYEIKYLCTGR